jgi:hypothetical protein
MLKEAIAPQLGFELLVGNGRLFAPLGNRCQIIQIFQQLLSIRDWEYDRRLLASLVREILQSFAHANKMPPRPPVVEVGNGLMHSGASSSGPGLRKEGVLLRARRPAPRFPGAHGVTRPTAITDRLPAWREAHSLTTPAGWTKDEMLPKRNYRQDRALQPNVGGVEIALMNGNPFIRGGGVWISPQNGLLSKSA